MTNPSKTLIAALLDRSGSMETSKAATVDTIYEVLYWAPANHRPGPGAGLR
jgi:hypothetical protein